MYLYDRNMVTNTNLKYVDSSSNYYIIMIVQNFEKIKNSKISNFFGISEARSAKLLFASQPQSGCCLRETRREAT